MGAKLPRLVNQRDNHYLLHKVVAAWIDDKGVLRFRFGHEDGSEYSGPFYPSLVDNESPQADKMLSRNGLTATSDIKFLVAYHSGSFPNGFPIVLLKDERDVPKRLTGP